MVNNIRRMCPIRELVQNARNPINPTLAVWGGKRQAVIACRRHATTHRTVASSVPPTRRLP